MGVRALPRIAEQLVAGGRAADEPVAVVERGTLPGQRTLLATLADVAERAAAERIRAPAITLVGPVAALREQLAWLERRPLHGRTIAVTRARPQASALAARLRELGAAVVEAPVIRTRALAAELPDLAGYDLVCVTSPNGAHALFERLGRAGLDARALAGRTVAAIGPGTASALAEHGIRADLVPERAVAEGLVEALAGVESAARWSCARARDATCCPMRCARAAPRSTSSRCTRPSPSRSTRRPRARRRRADYVTFTSASTVRFFLAAAGALDGPRIASIGPATSAALREAGLEPDLEADPHTPDGLVAALLADVRQGGLTPDRGRRSGARGCTCARRRRRTTARGRSPPPGRRTGRSSPPEPRAPGAGGRGAPGPRRPAGRCCSRCCCAPTTRCCRCARGWPSPTWPARPRS